MAEPLFDVWLEGVPLPGFAAEDVTRELAALFKTEPARIEALFGVRSAIKRGVDAATARRYQLALAKAGATAEVVPVTAGAVVAGDEAGATPISLSLAEPGVILIEPPRVPTPEFDLTAYTLAEPGVTLVEPAPLPVPEFNLSGLTLLPLDAPVYTAPSPAPAREFDTSGLSLQAVGSGHE